MGGADLDWHATQILWLTGRCPSTHRPQILNNGNSTYADLSALTVKLTGEALRSEGRGRRTPWLLGSLSKAVYNVASSGAARC